MQFFGSYFHQDWRLDDPTPEVVVQRFTRTHPAEEVRKVIVDLDQLLAINITETALRKMLVDDLLCYYMPPEAAPVRGWLQQVRAQLCEKATSQPS